MERSLFNLNLDNRLIAIKYIMLAGLATAIGLSYPLWLTEARYFPLHPLFWFVPEITYPFDYMLVFVTVLVIAVAFIYPFQYLINFSLLVLLLFLAMFDLNRMQPWLFHYLLILMVFCSIRNDSKSLAVPSLQLIFSALYFWGGVHKLNPIYFSDVIPWLTEPFGGAGLVHFIGFLVPATEIFIGIGLLFRKTRFATLLLATFVHLFSIYVIGPLGYNTNVVVWPWNIAMVAFVWLVYYKDEYYFKNIVHLWRRPFVLLLLLLVLVLPFFHLFGHWPANLSFNLYTGNTDRGLLYLGEGVNEMLPEEVAGLVKNNKLDVSTWAMKELKVPGWVEKGTFLKARDFMYDYARDSSEVVLQYQRKSSILGPFAAEFPE